MNKENLRTLLISVNRGWKYSNAGVDLLAGYLRNNGYIVDILYIVGNKPLDEIISTLDMSYDVYGMSIYESNYYIFLDIASYIKKNNPEAIIVSGGAFCSMFYKEIFNVCNSIDYMVLGDGEKPMQYILDCIKDSRPINHISVALKNDLIGKKNACNGLVDYLPAFDHYINVEPYQNKNKIHCIQSKNNICTGTCSFCYERKGKIVYKDISLVMQEIELVHDRFGVKKFFFADDNLADPNNVEAKNRIRLLCEEILKLPYKIIFTCYIKAISFNKEDSDLIELMHRAGFATIFIGIESGNEEDLLLYNKHTKVEDNYTTIELLSSHNIIPLVGFINYNPFSTRAKLIANYNFLKNIRCNNLYTYVCTFLDIYKGTNIYEMTRKEGLILPNYTITNTLAYGYKDEYVRDIAIFIKENMYNRVKELRLDTSYLLQRCADFSILNNECQAYKKRLNEFKDIECNVINEFFCKLYIKKDILWCENHLEDFFNIFEARVPILENILEELVNLCEQRE